MGKLKNWIIHRCGGYTFDEVENREKCLKSSLQDECETKIKEEVEKAKRTIVNCDIPFGFNLVQITKQLPRDAGHPDINSYSDYIRRDNNEISVDENVMKFIKEDIPSEYFDVVRMESPFAFYDNVVASIYVANPKYLRKKETVRYSDVSDIFHKPQYLGQ